ncbi:MAG: tRNA 2-thiouridine(34) synthase MnmA [Lachnospiraceae bacterium]|nr:tRNA 2-thiouridine(34) synthase MnmA [Lachnospiraceae bacterium]
MSKKALIAMSGGVDSSIAAKLMKDAGYECIGCTMKLYDNDDIGISKGHTCCSLDDVEDARKVAEANDMPYYVLNFKDGFNECVIKRFVDAYEAGRTPNPCIDCNRFMKFDKLFKKAEEFGCDYVVTGHYARIEEKDGKLVLKKGLDETKDQSYVLYSMTQEQLKHTLFPIGNIKKTEVRGLAEENLFVNANKPDSQDICFVPDGDYAAFLKRHTGKKYKTGDFIDNEGNVLGEHKGIVNYTIGQRKGLGVAFGKPLYVTDIRPDDNVVVLGENEDLFSKSFIVTDFNWISGVVPVGEISCKVKIRYRQKEQPATVRPLSDGRVEIEFDEPQRAITKGQAAVLYDGDIVLGGGTIEILK